MPSASIDRARGEIAKIDAQILALIARRQKVARTIGFMKKKLGLPIEDPLVEKLVLQRNLATAEAHKVGKPLAEALTQALIRMAKEDQG